MARRLGDRTGLATVLMRSYWSRGTSALDEILEMLTEARDLAAVLGNTEIQAEAMGWRVPALVALGDVDVARQQLDELLRTAEQTAQPFMFHVAEHFGSAIALCDGRLEAAEAMAHRSHEWSRAPDRTGRVGRLRDPDVQRPPRAGAPRGARAGRRTPRRRPGPYWAVAPRSRCAARRAGNGSRGEAGARQGRRRGARSLPRVALARDRSRTSPTRARRSATKARPSSCIRSSSRSRATNVMIGHLVSCYGAADRYLGMLASVLGEAERARAHFEARAGAEPPDGSADVARPHRVRVRAVSAVTSARPTATVPTRCWARPRRWPSGSGCRPSSGESRALRSSMLADALPDGLSAREAQVLRPHRARAEQPRDRCGARDQRAHGCQSRAQHPAQDALCESNRGCVLRASARSRHGVSGR